MSKQQLISVKLWAINHRVRKLYPHIKTEVTFLELQTLLSRYKYLCVKCHVKLPAKYFTVDHIVPLGRGGRHDISNLQPLCMSCNNAKGMLSIDYRPTIQND